MDANDQLCFNVQTWIQDALDDTHSWLWYTYSFIWIIGMLGNLSNIVVFNHKLMSKSYFISLLYWLAVCDFLELVSFFVLVFLNNFDFSETLKIFIDIAAPFLIINNSKLFQNPKFYVVFLLLTQHNISILLNITLAIVQYIMIVHPFQYKQSFSGNRSTKRVVNGILFLGIIICSLFLLSSFHYQGESQLDVIIEFNKSGNAYIKKHNYGNISGVNEVLDSVCRDAMNRRDGIFREYLSVNLKENEYFREMFTHQFGSAALQKYNTTTLLANFPFIKKNPYRGIDIEYGHFESLNYPVFISVLSSIIVRIGLLIVLIIASIGLIYGSIQASRIQRELRGSTSQITDRVTNRMTNVTMLILFIFSISEIPIVAYSLYLIPLDTLKINIYPVSLAHFTRYIFGVYNRLNIACFNSLFLIQNILMLVFLLFSSSYTVFCYLIMSTQYRDILKYVLCNIFTPPKNIPPNNQQTNIELTPL